MNLKHLLLAALAACSTGLFAKTTETDWATFEYPDLWDFRAPDDKGFDVIVTLKEGAPIEGNWLQPHLHWMKLMGYGGFQQWANPIKKPVVGKPYKFHYKPKVNEDEVHRYAFCAYLAPNGNDKQQVKTQFIDIMIPPPPPYEPKPPPEDDRR